jgi:hypothetical protein
MAEKVTTTNNDSQEVPTAPTLETASVVATSTATTTTTKKKKKKKSKSRAATQKALFDDDGDDDGHEKKGSPHDALLFGIYHSVGWPWLPLIIFDEMFELTDEEESWFTEAGEAALREVFTRFGIIPYPYMFSASGEW